MGIRGQFRLVYLAWNLLIFCILMNMNCKLNHLLQALRVLPRRAFLGVFFAMSFLLLAACEEIEEDKPWIQVERPQMLFTDTTLLDSYDKDVLNWKLKTAYLERWADKEIVFVRPVLVDIYDSLGERVAFLRADSGRLDMKFTYVYAYGHVYAITPKGASVRADSLLWNKKDNLVRTDSYVRVVSEDGDVLQGKGFESDAKMDHWRILSSVTGIFQDAAKRLKEEDKKQAEELEKNKQDSTANVAPTPTSSSTASPTSSPVAAPKPAPKPAVSPRPAPKAGRHDKSEELSPEDSAALEENKQARERVLRMRAHARAAAGKTSESAADSGVAK